VRGYTTCGREGGGGERAEGEGLCAARGEMRREGHRGRELEVCGGGAHGVVLGSTSIEALVGAVATATTLNTGGPTTQPPPPPKGQKEKGGTKMGSGVRSV